MRKTPVLEMIQGCIYVLTIFEKLSIKDLRQGRKYVSVISF